MRVARGLLGALAAAWLLAAAPAAAQVSGGSFGGGSFGGGSSSSYSGGGSSWSGSSSSGSWSGSSYSSSSGGGTPLSPGATLCLVAFFVVVFVLSHLAQRSKRAAAMRSIAPNDIDVAAIVLAIDARARPFVQQELERLAQSGETGTKAGLARLARETAMLLHRVESAWLYAHVVDHQPMPPPQAEQAFRRLAQDARSRFRVERIRNADGSTRVAAATGTTARAEEGEGVVVVTFLVAAPMHLRDVGDASNLVALKHLVRQVVAIEAENLSAIEVIWSPAEEDDRMSTAELEVLYPELRPLPRSSAVGRVFCAYCGGPFAGELEKCPHCGAPHEPPEPVNSPPQPPG